MDFLKFDAVKCTLCGKCIDKCPFGALRIEGKGIAVGDTCRMCGMCVRSCPSGKVVLCTVTDDMARSRIRILVSEIIEKQKTIDEEDILVVAGRGVRNEKDVEMCRRPCLGRGGHRTRVLPRRNAGIRRFSAGALR